jgi:hypothetical protein
MGECVGADHPLAMAVGGIIEKPVEDKRLLLCGGDRAS